ncbi:MAG: ATP-binding protein [Aureispira sp.]|nr:ATP-binding protein [Aureispira sp.]
MTTGSNMDLILDSHPKNIAEVEPFVNQVVQQFEIGDEMFGNMLISLTEAVSNAIIHGNEAKSSKKVWISTRCASNKICFSIKDEGRGFNPERLPDPTAPENILTPGGRGVFLMKQLSDGVSFSDNGTKVEIQFCMQ